MRTCVPCTFSAPFGMEASTAQRLAVCEPFAPGDTGMAANNADVCTAGDAVGSPGRAHRAHDDSSKQHCSGMAQAPPTMAEAMVLMQDADGGAGALRARWCSAIRELDREERRAWFDRLRGELAIHKRRQRWAVRIAKAVRDKYRTTTAPWHARNQPRAIPVSTATWRRPRNHVQRVAWTDYDSDTLTAYV